MFIVLIKLGQVKVDKINLKDKKKKHLENLYFVFI